MFCRDKKACADDRLTASFFAMIFISQLPVFLYLLSRKYSRVKRLILLRTTAFPTFLETVIPKRVLSVLHGAKITIKCLFCCCLPFAVNLRKSWRFNSLSALVKKKLTRYLPFTTNRFYYVLYLNAQTISAFSSTPVNNSSTLFCWHPFQKTVRSGTLYPAWLIGSFHITYPLNYMFIALRPLIFL